jgi:tetratricopeptide (TPR) repeat protein
MDVISDPQRRALHEVLSGAAARLDAGQPDEALKVLRSRGGFALENPVGKNILGEIHLHQGKPAEALRDFDGAIKLAPTFAEAHANRGAALIDLGRLMEALEAVRRAIRYKPKLAIGHFNRGIVLAALKQPEEAIKAFAEAIAARADFAEAFLNRGMAALDVDRPLEALADFRRAQALKPDLVEAYLGVVSAHRALGQRTDALAAADRALAVAPGDPRALTVKVGALVGVERHLEALPLVEELVAKAPDSAQSYVQRFAVLRGLKRAAAALADAETVIRLDPNGSEGHALRAMALSDLDRIEEAAEALAIAEKRGAASDAFFHVRAILMSDLGDLEEARGSYRKAIALEPDKAIYRHHYGMFLLSTGAFDKGWREHEWRLKDTGYGGVERLSDAPRWDGEDLAGKRILVLREQGSGDTIQFARFVPELRARGGAVTFLVLRPLAALLARSLAGADVTDSLGVRPAFDYQIPVMSIPAALATTLADLPGPSPYLKSDPARAEKWRARVGAEGFKIGIVWQGNPKYFRDAYRSIPLRHFAPIAAVPGVRLISLQAIHGLDQLNALPAGMRVETYGEEIANNPDGFEEIAALMANLDLVVTSDTVSAHLAGGLGFPTFVALRRRPDWRWMQERSDSPWYPTMRLFRQRAHGDWQGVFEDVAAAVAERATNASGGSDASR